MKETWNVPSRRDVQHLKNWKMDWSQLYEDDGEKERPDIVVYETRLSRYINRRRTASHTSLLGLDEER